MTNINEWVFLYLNENVSDQIKTRPTQWRCWDSSQKEGQKRILMRLILLSWWRLNHYCWEKEIQVYRNGRPMLFCIVVLFYLSPECYIKEDKAVRCWKRGWPSKCMYWIGWSRLCYYCDISFLPYKNEQWWRWMICWRSWFRGKMNVSCTQWIRNVLYCFYTGNRAGKIYKLLIFIPFSFLFPVPFIYRLKTKTENMKKTEDCRPLITKK